MQVTDCGEQGYSVMFIAAHDALETQSGPESPSLVIFSVPKCIYTTGISRRKCNQILNQVSVVEMEVVITVGHREETVEQL